MNEDYTLEKIADVLDNHFVDGDLVTENNVLEHVVKLLEENAELLEKNERLQEDLVDMSENL